MNCVVVFGREPRPGGVKTRLAQGIGDHAAAAVYGVLLEATLRHASTVGAHLVLSLAESPSSGWDPPLETPIEVQVDGDLGRRMGHSFARWFRDGYDRVVIIGSDCPELRPHHIVEAFKRLADVPVVLGPAVDGGYWLIGQAAPGRLNLSGIPWSSPGTLSATRDRMRDLGVDWQELAELRDIDRPEDFRWAKAAPEVDRELADRLRLAATTERRGSP